VSLTIGQVGRSDTGTTAREPDASGVVERDGVRVHWERYGNGGPPVLLLPTWWIVHSRVWKAQIPWLARHYRVVTFDGRGNGYSDRPLRADAYDAVEFVDDAVAVLDAAGVEAACVVGVSLGGLYGVHLAVRHPERVRGALLIGPTIPFITPPDPERSRYSWEDELGTDEGWAKYNKHYWLRDYHGFLEFFIGQIFPEPHSTKQMEDLVAFGHDTTGEVLAASQLFSVGLADKEDAEEYCRRVSCPVVVAHGTEDRVILFERGARLAELTGGELVRMEGAGHAPQARHPVQINLLIRELVERAAGGPPRGRTWTRSLVRPKRALFVSSPIGLGHAWRDVAIADELRRRTPGLEIHWLAQEPVTTLLRARGEAIHPASVELASEAVHIDREAGEHELHAFQAIRRMDEILCANFMLFHDVVSEDRFDLWIGDEAWEVDYYLHENPELKTAPYVWLTDFVGFLPMPDGGDREALLTADYNQEMIEHVERFPAVRDLAIFIGEPEDIVDESFGPGLPQIRDWTRRHYEFAGYVPGFDPGAIGDRDALRAELGYGDEPLCLVAVGGSAVGEPLLRRLIEAIGLARRRVPDLRALVVPGPRIDTETLPAADGVEVRGYVHELFRHAAACDVAVVQGGLSTTMELVALQRPFISMPLVNHFEQRLHVRRRLDRYGARAWLDYADADPERLAAALAGMIAGERPSYRSVDRSGAEKAAELITCLLQRA
jgi:pimeloyl-ACP methyl ester carboxylesterase/predicted glycosyltransferase